MLALDKGKFKPPPPMTTPVEKRNACKCCEFHGEVGHTTDECMHLKRQIEEMLKAGKLSHLIKELKQSNGKDQAKATKMGETSRKNKPLAILMEDGTDGPMIIKAEMGGHYMHRMYVDGGSSSEILYEHCFNRFRPKVRNQMIPATTPLVGFSGEIIWPLGQISLLARGKENPGSPIHSTWNAKIPSDRWNGHITEQHDYSTRMHNGFRTMGAASRVTLTEERQKELCGLLRHNLDIFAWKPADMTRVSWHIAEHMLNIREGCLPVRQKKREQVPERNKAIYEEVEKLVVTGIMKEVHYHSWLSNPVMVKKHNDSRVPLRISVIMFLGRIQRVPSNTMAKEDEEKTSFITSQGIFCYSKMLFGLKNARATYQRLVDKALQKQIGQNLEVYVDDLIIKRRTKQEVIRDIEETFKTLREINIKLNPKKCAFGNIERAAFWGTRSAQRKAISNGPRRQKWHLNQMKKLIAELPMLTAPKDKEELITYLAAAKEATGAVLMTERDGKQMPIYFVSRALQGPEINYTPMEKLILALWILAEHRWSYCTHIDGNECDKFLLVDLFTSSERDTALGWAAYTHREVDLGGDTHCET
ncbi:reverse transcriptase domain-containing protein [Tanacetum coccineum]|uniref:Reverse transcriptase domain-containing protein n=1 Tax=Tanacetum coccineum TaxID=301880 RepID=A0ABQ5GMC9_9ASTR